MMGGPARGSLQTCHPECSEGSVCRCREPAGDRRSFAALRM